MMLLKLAYKNLKGAGGRTWLNVLALSFPLVAIIALQGIYNGMNRQLERANIDAQYGGGQYWHKNYDPREMLTLDEAHGAIPEDLRPLINRGEAAAILMVQGTIYPHGRLQQVVLKGISPDQQILDIPTSTLKNRGQVIPALIASRMAKSAGLNIGDVVVARWRDVNSTFDARELQIAAIMNTAVQDIDIGQVWLPLETLWEMTGMRNQATVIVLAKNNRMRQPMSGWTYKSLDELLADQRMLAKVKTAGASIFYIVLLLLAMLAIFDTQVLSIFRRRKEMGTLMALGLTRVELIALFTLEGAMHAILAAMVAAVYGTPLMAYLAKNGYRLPEGSDNYGYALGDAIYPIYSAELVAGTVVLVLVLTTLVSYLPTRKIGRLNPTDALRGRLT
jgi:ABC-type lipoprotein release transport system permease subunit